MERAAPSPGSGSCHDCYHSYRDSLGLLSVSLLCTACWIRHDGFTLDLYTGRQPERQVPQRPAVKGDSAADPIAARILSVWTDKRCNPGIGMPPDVYPRPSLSPGSVVLLPGRIHD